MAVRITAEFNWAEVKIIRAWAATYFEKSKARPSKYERMLLDKIIESDRLMSEEWRKNQGEFQYDDKGNN